MQGILGQAATGVCMVLMPLYATARLAGGTGVAPGFAVGAIETGLGVGLVLGSVIVGGIGHRTRAGRLVIAGYASSGLLIALFGISGNLWLAVPLVVAGGIANMAYVIPSLSLFGRLVPAEMLGRVISMRRAMTSGAYLVGMQLAGVFGTPVGFGAVLVAAGMFTFFTGALGGFFRQVRNAD
jgi:MFS family permease